MEQQKLSLKDTFITGFALFAMFLGAGNLIFPPYIGIQAGSHYYWALLGFMFTGIAMPLLGLISTAKAGGSLQELSGCVSKRFATIFNILILLAIGPLLAIPRTAATAYEVGLIPIFGELNWGMWGNFSISRICISFLYFAINLIFVLKPSKVIEAIGKYFTPVLLTLLLWLIVKGIFFPIGNPGIPKVPSSFTMGFKEGYQTMDALASMAFAGIAVESIRRKLTSEKAARRATMMSSIIAAMGLFIVYGGFIYLGATGSIVFSDIARTEATVKLVRAIGNEAGKIALSISMCVACLTTSIGLITTISDFFSELFQEKLSYKTVVYVTVGSSFFISIFGVNTIIRFAVPLLETLYPAAIVIILLNLFRERIQSRSIYRGAVVGALVTGVFYGIAAVNPELSIIQKGLYQLPLGKAGFFWVITAVIGALLWRVTDVRKKDVRMANQTS
ncbi:MAG: branched-chain amino acid transport system II carrier protein [Tissierellia bacterium]|nr:branched-chain amino acid transport system II carrier protein [Tissierellia bacterium]